MTTQKNDPSKKEAKRARSVSSQNYNAVVEVANLVDIVLVKSNFELDPSYFDEASAKTFSFDLSQVQVRVDKDTGRAQGAFRWVLKATVGEGSPLRLETTFLVIYGNLQDSD